jgi:hypothetical protein
VSDFTYDDNSLWVFVLLTVILGGGAAMLAGRAIAATWRSWWQVIPLALLLGAAVRFLYFALYSGTLLSLTYYVVDTAVCLACGLLGFRAKRASQMVTSYGWLNEHVALLTWRRKATTSDQTASESE